MEFVIAPADAPIRRAHHDRVARAVPFPELLLALLAAGGTIAAMDAVLTGHVHDPFDIAHQVGGRTIRMIGAGTLSQRLRSTAPSYNRLEWSAGMGLQVSRKTLG